MKEIAKSAIEERQVVGVYDMKMLVMECAMVKNNKINHHGFTPSQWVLGRLPTDLTSLTSEDADATGLGVQAEIMEPEDIFSRQLEIRQAAKQAFAKVDSSRRIRAALLRKSVPLRGPYSSGDLVCFYRRGRWHGPGRIIGKESRSTFWVVHAGIPIVVAESQIRPATSSEAIAKQILELRPHRKRKREYLRGGHQEEEDEHPFAEDTIIPALHEEDQQPAYVDLPEEAPTSSTTFGLSSSPPVAQEEDMADDIPVPLQPPGGLNPMQAETEEDIEEIEVPQRQETSQEPEEEETPFLHRPVPPPPGLDTSLRTALVRSVNALDGIPEMETPYPQERERSRSPHREAHVVPVPASMDGLYAQQRQEKYFHCFLAKRIFKKRRQVGAGREVQFKKSSQEVQDQLLKTRQKEWSNWVQFTAARILPPEEQEEFFAEHPDTEIIPTRWVDTNKSEEGEEPQYKSRLVARGDLEQNNRLRTDSPTSSQLFLNLIISYAASTNQGLRGGDISAAFLQGTGIKRSLALRLPADGIPDPAIPEGSLLICEKSVYGTKDAPRGFWKGLHDVLVSCGLKEVPYETSAYYLPGRDGTVSGMLGTHVDDLLWCGIKEMDDIMQKVQQHYNFRLTSSHEFKFCGRIIKQDSTGITINCPSVLDRVKAIYIDPKRRKMRGLDATPSEVSQLRSVVGSLSWYSRVCRPDLSFQVNQLQAVQQRARVEDLVSANRLLHFALETKERGIFYASGVMDFDDAMILSINDASHAASYDINNNGEPMGHRSQSGRILALVRKDFIKTGDEVIHMLQWTSTVIKRVCRSTLQAETLSMQLGSEESEHLRQLLYVMKNLAKSDRSKENLIAAMDGTTVMWCTDCRSLSDHLVNPGVSEVSDKRLAIDLTSLRQDLWRVPGESVGNPTYTDALPEGRSTLCSWISTKTMAADGLTKAMRCEQLQRMMENGRLTVEFQSVPCP